MASVDTLARDFQRAIEDRNAPALQSMLDALARLLPGLVQQARDALDRVSSLRASGQAGEAAVFAALRARSIAQQIEAETARLVAHLRPELLNGQQAAVEAGLSAARTLTEAALPAGVTLDVLALQGRPWVTAPLDAVRRLIGGLGPDSPLVKVLNLIAPDTGRRVREALTAGLVRGSNPRVVARTLRREVGLPAVRAETIARTEMLRAYRGASLAAYQANGDIVPTFRRLAAKSGRTCPMCLALDGTKQETSELMAVHPNDRCAVVPIVNVTAFGLLEPTEPESGAQWFARQDRVTQERVLGPGGVRLYRAGTPLSAFVRVTESAEWGPTLQRRPNREIAA